MSSNQSGEGEIRKAIVEADLVHCMVAMPGQLFYSTQIPVCLWFVARTKSDGKRRDSHGEILFIDPLRMGTLIDRVHRDLAEEDITKTASTSHAWRGDKGAGDYEDVAGFCKSVTLEEIRSHGHVLTPGRYVGAEEAEDDDEPVRAFVPVSSPPDPPLNARELPRIYRVLDDRSVGQLLSCTPAEFLGRNDDDELRAC